MTQHRQPVFTFIIASDVVATDSRHLTASSSAS